MLGTKQQGLRLPGAISPGTPMSDVTKTRNSFYSNEMVDNVLVSRDGFCDAATRVYGHGHDLKDPLLSPIYGGLHGFPPAILTTGDKRPAAKHGAYAKLREAGVDSQLEVYESQSHAQDQWTTACLRAERRSARSPHFSTSTSVTEAAGGRVANLQERAG
jgi:monoterpene epsilon-lactone hydrolase